MLNIDHSTVEPDKTEQKIKNEGELDIIEIDLAVGIETKSEKEGNETFQSVNDTTKASENLNEKQEAYLTMERSNEKDNDIPRKYNNHKISDSNSLRKHNPPPQTPSSFGDCEELPSDLRDDRFSETFNVRSKTSKENQLDYEENNNLSRRPSRRLSTRQAHRRRKSSIMGRFWGSSVMSLGRSSLQINSRTNSRLSTRTTMSEPTFCSMSHEKLLDVKYAYFNCLFDMLLEVDCPEQLNRYMTELEYSRMIRNINNDLYDIQSNYIDFILIFFGIFIIPVFILWWRLSTRIRRQEQIMMLACAKYRHVLLDHGLILGYHEGMNFKKTDGPCNGLVSCT